MKKIIAVTLIIVTLTFAVNTKRVEASGMGFLATLGSVSSTITAGSVIGVLAPITLAVGTVYACYKVYENRDAYMQKFQEWFGHEDMTEEEYEELTQEQKDVHDYVYQADTTINQLTDNKIKIPKKVIEGTKKFAESIYKEYANTVEAVIPYNYSYTGNALYNSDGTAVDYRIITSSPARFVQLLDLFKEYNDTYTLDHTNVLLSIDDSVNDYLGILPFDDSYSANDILICKIKYDNQYYWKVTTGAINSRGYYNEDICSNSYFVNSNNHYGMTTPEQMVPLEYLGMGAFEQPIFTDEYIVLGNRKIKIGVKAGQQVNVYITNSDYYAMNGTDFSNIKLNSQCYVIDGDSCTNRDTISVGDKTDSIGITDLQSAEKVNLRLKNDVYEIPLTDNNVKTLEGIINGYANVDELEGDVPIVTDIDGVIDIEHEAEKSDSTYHLPNLLEGLLDILKEFARWLFVPSEDFMENTMTACISQVQESCGMLTYPISLLVTFVNGLDQLSEQDCIFHIPNVPYMGTNIIQERYVNITQLIKQNTTMNTVYYWYLKITDFIIAIGLVGLARKKYEKIINGGAHD